MKREMFEFGPHLRLENGPKRKRAIATKELLSNEVTASHYTLGAFDARGKRIKLGEEMEYLDYLGDIEWILYEWRPVMLDKYGNVTTDERIAIASDEKFMPIKRFADKDAAIKAAKAVKRSRTIEGIFRKLGTWMGED